MILSLAIIINVTAALILLAGLAYAMSRTTRLTPHLAAAERSVGRAAERSVGRLHEDVRRIQQPGRLAQRPALATVRS